MDTRWTGRDVLNGNQVSWEEVPPADLRLRLDDVLQYEGCTSDDLWEAIRDWMESRGITRTRARPLSVVSQIEPTLRAHAIAPILQSESAMHLTRLVYTSQCESFDTSTAESILQSSKKNNARDVLTGILVVQESTILQVLEGSRDAIAKCFARIMKDPRHHDVQVIACGDVSRRLFQEWHMRLVDVASLGREILSVHCIDGRLQPALMSEFAMEEFCRALAHGGFEAK